MKLTDLALLLPLVAATPACSSLASGTADKAPAVASTEKPSGADEEQDDDKESTADKVRKAEHALEDARADLKIARQECQAAERKQKDELDEAEYDAAKAKEALDVFQRTSKPLELSKLALSLERSEQQVSEVKQELEEIMAMYKKEDFASLTKELVVSRNKKRLEFANRELEHERADAANTREVELPRKEKDLDLEVKKAENSLREARAEKAKLSDENELKMKKAERAVDEAEKDLAKLKKKAAAEAKGSKDGQAAKS